MRAGIRVAQRVGSTQRWVAVVEGVAARWWRAPLGFLPWPATRTARRFLMDPERLLLSQRGPTEGRQRSSHCSTGAAPASWAPREPVPMSPSMIRREFPLDSRTRERYQAISYLLGEAPPPALPRTFWGPFRKRASPVVRFGCVSRDVPRNFGYIEWWVSLIDYVKEARGEFCD